MVIILILLFIANITSVCLESGLRKVTKMSRKTVNLAISLEENTEQDSNFKMDKSGDAIKTRRLKMLSFDNVYLLGLTVQLIHTLLIANAKLRSVDYNINWTEPYSSSNYTRGAIDFAIISAVILFVLIMVVIVEKMGALGKTWRPRQATYCLNLLFFWIGLGLSLFGYFRDFRDGVSMNCFHFSFILTGAQLIIWVGVFAGSLSEETESEKSSSTPIKTSTNSTSSRRIKTSTSSATINTSASTRDGAIGKLYNV